MARKHRIRADAVDRFVVVDSGAVTKVAGGDRDAKKIWNDLELSGWLSVIPAAVLAEVVTGRPEDARVNQFIKIVGDIGVDDEAVGRLAGALRYQASRSSRTDIRY